MTRLPILALAALSLVATPTLLFSEITPAAAQEDDWSTGMSDRNGRNLRDLLQDWIQERTDRRDMLIDLVQERRDRRDELLDALRERMDRRSDLRGFLTDHPWLVERLRDRIAARWDGEGGGGDGRSPLRERLAERLGGNCYFITRSLRNQDGSLLVLVRRRVCRD